MTQALDVSILVALEPLATALLAFVFLKETFGKYKRFAVVFAAIGVLLLSEFGKSSEGTGVGFRLFGNLLFLISIFCEASHTVFGRNLTRKYHPLALSAYAFALGTIGFALINYQAISLSKWQNFSWQAWLAVLYLGVICSAVGYTAWFFLLRKLPANTVALSLYIQPVAGTLIGIWILNESMTMMGAFGALIILISTIWVYSKEWQKKTFRLEEAA